MLSRKFLRSIAPIRCISLLLCILLIASAAVQAQSGRRIPKRPAPSDTTPPTSTEPTVEQAKPKDEKPKIPIVVTREQNTYYNSSIWSNVAVQACLKRLSESESIEPRAAREMNRKEASDAAKGSPGTYVVLIELEIDPIYSSQGRGTMGTIDPRYLYINYTVFTPSTGKVKSAGHVYPSGRGAGNLPLPGRVPNTTAGAEYMMQEAGRETADRVLAAIGLPLPPQRRY